MPVDVTRLYSLDASLTYTHVRNSLGSVDEETGTKWNLAFLGRVVDGEAVPKLYATFDRGLAVPFEHSSIWLRSAAGYSPRSRAEPFANFFFGGFGNNYVDYQNEKRYREYYSFPGADLNAIGGGTSGRRPSNGIAAVAHPPCRHAGFLRDVGATGPVRQWTRH